MFFISLSHITVNIAFKFLAHTSHITPLPEMGRKNRSYMYRKNRNQFYADVNFFQGSRQNIKGIPKSFKRGRYELGKKITTNAMYFFKVD